MTERKTLRTAENPTLDTALYMWFKQCRADGVPISGPLLTEKAKYFHNELKITSDCNYSSGWLQKFKKRHGIRHLNIVGEQLSADGDAATLFIETFSKFVTDENLTVEQIYNADETDIFWKCLPHNTLVTSDEARTSGIKVSKERLTALVCSNAAGTHKCKLLVIGKSAKPRALKGIRQLPVVYKANKRAWITQDLTIDWFENHFVPEARAHCEKVGLPRNSKIILLLDNCPAHPDENRLRKDNVHVMYIPPNCTSLIQPMDQGVIRSLKCHYRKEMMRKITGMDTSEGILALQKSFNIKDFIWCVFRAWNAVTTTVLQKSWYNIWPDLKKAGEEVENSEALEAEQSIYDLVNVACIDETCTREDVVNWINCDDNAPVHANLTDGEIIDVVLNPPSAVEIDSDNDSSDSEVHILGSNKLTMDEAIECCGKLIGYLETKKFINEQEIIQLNVIQDKLIRENRLNQKQTTLDQYFIK